jgi:hypothetical protein
VEACGSITPSKSLAEVCCWAAKGSASFGFNHHLSGGSASGLSKETQSRITGLLSTTLLTKRARFVHSNIRKSVKDNLGNAWRIGLFIQILAQSARNSVPWMQWS